MSLPREQTSSMFLMWEQYVQIFASLSLKCLTLLGTLNYENGQGKGKKDFLLVTAFVSLVPSQRTQYFSVVP